MAEQIISPITKEAARVAGLKHFFTGIPCAQGHRAERYVSSGKCAECRRIKSAKERLENIEYFRSYSKRYASTNRERYIEYAAEWRTKNPEKYASSRARWQSQNKDKMRRYDTEYRRNRYLTDPAYRCIQLIRARYGIALRQAKLKKGSPLRSCLGYTGTDLMAHLERQFVKGMSWDNHGDWHIDHIVPISQYMSEGVTDPAVINRLSNLRPIWAADNLAKGAKQTSLL